MNYNTIPDDIKLFMQYDSHLLILERYSHTTSIDEMIVRYKFIWCAFVSVLLLSGGSASVLKDDLEEHLKDLAHDEAAESVKLDKQKGEKIHEEENVLNDQHKNQFSKANDESKYLKKEHDTKASSDSDAYDGYNSQKDKVEDSHATGYKKGHKKGHHKQGFQNSYHKDESSNKSTYFDDLNDEGDVAAYNSRLKNHDNHGDRRYQGSHNNGQEYVKNNYHGGGYNRHGDSGIKNTDHRDYGKKYYLDDVENYNKYHDDRNSYDRGKVHDRHEFHAPQPAHNPGWDWQKWDERRRWERPSLDREHGWDRNNDWGRGRGWDRDPGWNRDQDWGNEDWNRGYGGPGYYDDHGLRHNGGYGYGPNHGYGYGESRNDPVSEVPRNTPVVAQHKQTITIYEDPRYDGTDKGQLRRQEGDLQLEYKPSNQRYASYDDTYYSVPRRDGGVKASKINRLVYNSYRRQ